MPRVNHMVVRRSPFPSRGIAFGLLTNLVSLRKQERTDHFFMSLVETRRALHDARLYDGQGCSPLPRVSAPLKMATPHTCSSTVAVVTLWLSMARWLQTAIVGVAAVVVFWSSTEKLSFAFSLHLPFLGVGGNPATKNNLGD